jgi:putative ubiquitin-RnfH superfamily antitoxin RatB of RatAB toxin-antitoxin module
MMRVSVAYVDPGTTFWQALEVDEGCNILYAINHSGLLAKVPSVDLENQKVGIFGKVAKLDTLLKEGDRVEVYRPITATPDDDDDDE